MGRVLVEVEVRNPLDKRKVLRFQAAVEPNVSQVLLPNKWKHQLGEFGTARLMCCERQGVRFDAEVCGPVSVRLEEFRTVSSEVVFLSDRGFAAFGVDEFPAIGSVVLTQSQAALDSEGQRLVKVAALDLE